MRPASAKKVHPYVEFIASEDVFLAAVELRVCAKRRLEVTDSDGMQMIFSGIKKNKILRV